jgi:ADP-ribosylglycohydrolase
MLEKYGLNLTTADIGQTWLDILPMACTAEDIALKNLKKGVSAYETADIDNPYVQWIGADIRSDPWGYAAAGYPEKAAELAYRDAYLSHRRNGIYGEMYFSAVIAAAFTVKTAEEALRIGLTEIPKECSLYGDITWALDNAKDIHNYREARSAVDKKFGGMHSVHTNNNACLVVFGLLMHDGDFTKTIAEVVAMGLDNDCTGATAGSIMGILVGKKGIDPAWYENFNDTVESYITGYPTFKISDVIKRFIAVADKNYQ